MAIMDVKTGRRQARGDGFGALQWLGLVLSGLMLVPLTALIVVAVTGTSRSIPHYVDTVLGVYTLTTVQLVVMVGIATAIIGTVTAWLVTMCEFPGRRILSWALVLPFAMPAYVSAYAYTYLLQHPGPVQTALRNTFDLSPTGYWFPDIRSVGGAAFVLSLVLYPYVYLLARTAFLQQTASHFHVSRSLGRSPWGAFFGVAVPLARPAIVAGVALALMETVADYGTVYHFGVQTFTTAIYRTWFSMGDRVAAVQLALALVGMVVLLLALERIGRRGRRFSQTRAGAPMAPMVLSGWRAAGAVAACVLPIVLGFFAPVLTLLHVAASLEVPFVDPLAWPLVDNTLTLATVGAGFTVACAVIIAYARRISRPGLMTFVGQLAGFGYAVPGAVIAVGLLIPFGLFDRWQNRLMIELFDWRTGAILTGTIATLVFAYVVRFLAVALNGVEAGLARIPASFDQASRSLGSGPTRTLRRVHAPLLTGGLLTAFMITFVDIVKELPATLILRPFNFDTLAIRAYRLASDERLAMASVPSLMIVAVAMVPVVFLTFQITRTRVEDAQRTEPGEKSLVPSRVSH